MRSSPSFSPPSGVSREATGRRKLMELEFHTITPIFGGSAVAGRTDQERPVTGRTIRGHLRFWWRACKAGRYGSAKELFEAEERIWGSTDSPSAIDVVVKVISSGASTSCAEYHPKRDGTYGGIPTLRNGYPQYALFPFLGRTGHGEILEYPASVLEGTEFVLSLGASASTKLDRDELSAEVGSAIWAWALFGGIGARTRRGCGSLFCKDWPFTPLGNDPVTAIRTDAPRMIAGGACMEGLLPRLAGARMILGRRSQCLLAWADAVKTMAAFRQEPGLARNTGQSSNRPGRSRWPEPDSIRRITRMNAPNHLPEHPSGVYFPRADLGLPIVFHFKDWGEPSHPDPLLDCGEAGRTRMASPVILKPLALSSTEAVPLALILNAPHIWDAGTPGARLGGRMLSTDELTDTEKSAKVSPLKRMGADGARDAFVLYVEECLGAKEVIL